MSKDLGWRKTKNEKLWFSRLNSKILLFHDIAGAEANYQLKLIAS